MDKQKTDSLNPKRDPGYQPYWQPIAIRAIVKITFRSRMTRILGNQNRLMTIAIEYFSDEMYLSVLKKHQKFN